MGRAVVPKPIDVLCQPCGGNHHDITLACQQAVHAVSRHGKKKATVVCTDCGTVATITEGEIKIVRAKYLWVKDEVPCETL